MTDIIQGSLDVMDLKIGMVTAKFNSPVTEKLEQGALTRFSELGFKKENIFCVRVPGAVEITLATKWLLEQGCDAVVTLGAVIRGETSHYDYVCNSVERGCTELMLTTGKPVAFGVLTTENGEQAFARAGGKKGNKGAEAVDVVIEMLNLKNSIKKITIKETPNAR
ncbi:MAG: 6,7-dimethyl-8-ribityllumazine synthase [Bdellovibrionaceae bacterium]|nr:6,7-dimethyl-8-ribityllumazine synthase [Pseudobdellovibrionaceae bacterium]